MRILYLTHQYFPRWVGGTEVYTRGLVRRAVRAGHEVEVLTYHESPSADPRDYGLHRTEHEGVPLTEIEYGLGMAPDPARYEYDNPFIGDLVRAEIARFQPDLVHAMHVMKLSGAALEASIEAGIPTVVTLCDFWFVCPRHTLLTWDGRVCDGPRTPATCVRCVRHTHGFANSSVVRKLPEWAEHAWVRVGLAAGMEGRFWRDVRAIGDRSGRLRELLLRGDRILSLSPFQKEMFVRNGFPADRLEVVDHGLELDGLEPVRPDPGAKPKLVFSGHFAPHKGAHLLLEALQNAPDVDFECLLYGGGRAEDPYVRRVRDLASRDPRVRLMGTFPPDEMGRVLAGAAVMAVPALWYENNPLMVKAAVHLGLPVIASRIGCLPEWVRPGENGWLAESGDAGSWAEGLRRAREEWPRLWGTRTKVKSMDENAAELFRIYAEAGAGVHA